MTTTSYLIGQGYDNLRKHGSKTFSTMLIICATMFILGLFIILLVNIKSNVATVSGTQGLQAFISEEVSDSEIEDLAIKVNAVSNIKNIKYIDKSEALEDAKSTLKDYAYLLEGMEDSNPFPRSFIITFEKLENTEAVKDAIESIDGIYKVSYNEKIIDAVISISRIANYAIIIVAIVMMVVSVFIISNTIKLAVYSNKREIYIMKYLGATSRFIKIPFIVEGVIMGLASSIISWIIITLTYSIAFRYLPKVGAELGVFGFVGYSTMWYLILIAFVLLGIFLGWVGSSMATRKYLKEFRPIKNSSKKLDNDDKQKRALKKAQEKAEIKLKKENLKREAKEKQKEKKDEKQDFERKRKARRLTVILLMIVISFPMINVFAQTTQQKIEDIDKQSSEATKKYEAVQSDIKVYEADIDKLDTEVDKYSKEVDTLTTSLKNSKADVEKIAEELQNVSTNYETTEQLLNTRLKVLYENGFVSMWEVLFSSENLTDFIAKYNVIATLIEKDKKDLQEMQNRKKYIQNLKESADLKRLQVEQAEYDVQKSKEALEAAKQNKENALSELEKSKSELKTLLANLKKEKQKQERILAAERAAAAGSVNLVFSSGFKWPAPGVYYVTAMFRDKEYYYSLGLMHYGTDIAKSGGCPIVAAQAGKVISVIYSNSGYGNHIQIAHGTGKDGATYVTLYGHLKSINVKKGDYVVEGQQIGYMGSTGFSTGTHLHFEIIRNGTKVNAMSYYPELAGTAVYYSYGKWISFPFSNMSKYQI